MQEDARKVLAERSLLEEKFENQELLDELRGSWTE